MKPRRALCHGKLSRSAARALAAPAPLALAALASALALLSGAGCTPGEPVEEPSIIDVRPARLQLGDTLIVESTSYWHPSPRASAARRAPAFRAGVAETRVILDGHFVWFDGSVGPQRVELLAYAVPTRANPARAERVLARIDHAAEERLGRARFEGRVGVWQRAEGEEPVTVWSHPDSGNGEAAGSLQLSFFEPSMRNLSQQFVAWLTEKRLLRWMGVDAAAVEGGLRVLGPAEPAPGQLSLELRAGDLIVKASGRPLRSAEQLAAMVRRAPARSEVGLTVVRDGQEQTIAVPVSSRPLLLPASAIYLAVMLVFGLILLTACLVIGGSLTWLERRVAGRIQSRVGPNRVGPQGYLQWLADGIKLLLKEDIIPDAVDRPLFKLAPYLVFIGLFGTFVVLPFGQWLIVADLNVGLIYLLAITGMVSIGLMMAGWSSNNKWSLLGGMRSAAQIISYEIPTGLALMVPVILAGTLSTQSLVERQGGWPWQWHAFDNPLLFVCFVIYFVSALAEGNRTPFDLPEAESELVAGYNIEYSGWRFAVFFLSEWANLFVVGAVATTVFLGGWQVPGVSLELHASSWVWQLLGLLLFFVKAMTLVFVIIWVRWTLPRFRVDQLMALCWKFFVPWTFASILLVAAWAWLAPGWLRLAVQLATFALCGVGSAWVFFARVAHNWQENPEKRFTWNPFV